MPLPYDLCARLQNGFRQRQKFITVTHTNQHLGILSILLRSGLLISLTRGTVAAPDPSAFHAAPEAQKRIWAELKYREGRPVMNGMSLISKPSRRIFMDLGELRRLCSGRRAQNVKPLGMGEVAVVKTKKAEAEWVEAREALQMGLAGEVVCRAK